MADDKCKRCGACQHCGSAPYPVYYPAYYPAWWSTAPQPPRQGYGYVGGNASYNVPNHSSAGTVSTLGGVSVGGIQSNAGSSSA